MKAGEHASEATPYEARRALPCTVGLESRLAVPNQDAIPFIIVWGTAVSGDRGVDEVVGHLHVVHFGESVDCHPCERWYSCVAESDPVANILVNLGAVGWERRDLSVCNGYVATRWNENGRLICVFCRVTASNQASHLARVDCRNDSPSS